jgi:hypothetical protein
MKRFSVIATVLALVLGLSSAASASPDRLTGGGQAVTDTVRYVLTPRPVGSPDVSLFRVGSHHMMGGGCDTFMLGMSLVL